MIGRRAPSARGQKRWGAARAAGAGSAAGDDRGGDRAVGRGGDRAVGRGGDRAVGRGGDAGRRDRPERRAPKPLDAVRLNDLALHYVARFATTEHKLASYLARKVRERGWDDGSGADASGADGRGAHGSGTGGSGGDGRDGTEAIAAIVARLAALRYIDDRGFAVARGAALERRGLGRRRIAQQLHVDGIAPADAAEPLDHADGAARDTALAFARRRRMGPYAREAVTDPARRRAQIAAFARAGHSAALAARIIALPPRCNEDDDPARWDELLGEP